MKFFQFARILAFCCAGEILHELLPFPIPSSVYGLALLLLALLTGFVRVEQVRDTAAFLTGIFPVLFIPAAAGVMDLWDEVLSMLVPIVIAVVGVTILVMTVSGKVTQALLSRNQEKGGAE